MVANAAIGPTDEFLDITPEFFENLYRINVFGMLYSYQAAARQYIKQGTPGKLIGGYPYSLCPETCMLTWQPHAPSLV